MSAIGQNARAIVYEAQQENLERMLEAWDKEIEAAIAQRLKVQKQRAQDKNEVAEVEGDLRSLIAQARAGDVVTVPAGISVAAAGISISIGDEISALHNALENLDDLHDVERSVAQAMMHGMVPHPADIADIIQPFDHAWAQAFRDCAEKLEGFTAVGQMVPQLHAEMGAEKLSVVQQQKKLMQGYGTGRLMQAILRPDLLRDNPAPLQPVQIAQAQPPAIPPGLAAGLNAFQRTQS